MPFMSDELYQNLVISLDPQAPNSVHLAEWPTFDVSLIDDSLNAEMDLVMRLASLGHGARNKANRKVRQPLAEVAFSLGNAEEKKVVSKYADLLADELNVKSVRTLDASGEAVSYSLNPLPKQFGQKYGKLFPAIRTALMGVPADQAANTLLQGLALPVEVENNVYDILPEEVEVRAQAKSGYAVASEGAYLAALVTDLTPELVKEGLAREFVRRVQDLRKSREFEISDRIHLTYAASPLLSRAIESNSEYIKNETLCLSMKSQSLSGESWFQDEFDGETIALTIEKAS